MIFKREHVRIIRITGIDVQRWLEQQGKGRCLHLVKRKNSLVSWELMDIIELYKCSFQNSTPTFNLPALILWRHHLLWGKLLFQDISFSSDVQAGALQFMLHLDQACRWQWVCLEMKSAMFPSNFEHGNYLYSIRSETLSSPSNSTQN